MARLPVPGGDVGNWGTILNDFLGQAHASDGALKAGAVGATQLQDDAITEAKLAPAVQSKINTDPVVGGDLSGTASNAQIVAGAVATTELAASAVTTAKIADQNVTTAKIADLGVTTAKLASDSVASAKVQNNAITTVKIADGAITSSKLAPSVGGTTDGLRSLLIYYAPPDIINARYSNDYAAGILSRYDDVVLGTGLQDPGNPSYAATVDIIQKVAVLSPDTVIWGYIDCGVDPPTSNHSLATLQTQIDQWLAIGAGGIFCDVIGYAYGVSRTRQNDIINYIHGQSVGAILNVWDPDEIFSSAVDPTYNPGGVATAANSSDVYLLESWVCNSDAYSSPYYATFSDIKTRGDAARVYRGSLGVRIFAVNIIEHNTRTEEQLDEYRGMCEALARTWRLDGSGVSAATYAATGADTGIVAPRFPKCRASQLRPTAPYVLNGTWTEVEAPDLGLTVHYEPGTHTWQEL